MAIRSVYTKDLLYRTMDGAPVYPGSADHHVAQYAYNPYRDLYWRLVLPAKSVVGNTPQILFPQTIKCYSQPNCKGKPAAEFGFQVPKDTFGFGIPMFGCDDAYAYGCKKPWEAKVMKCINAGYASEQLTIMGVTIFGGPQVTLDCQNNSPAAIKEFADRKAEYPSAHLDADGQVVPYAFDASDAGPAFGGEEAAPAEEGPAAELDDADGAGALASGLAEEHPAHLQLA